MVTPQSIKNLSYVYAKSLQKILTEMIPSLNELYSKLKKEKAFYDINLDKMGNIKNLPYSGDADYYAGIINPGEFTHNNRAIYFHCESMQFVLQFIDKGFTDSFDNEIWEGVRAFRIYSPLDIKCIEESWGVKTTEQWTTQLDLCRETFTDLTSHSQNVGEGEVVCRRPTIDIYLRDHNKKKAVCFYDPIFSTSSNIEGNWNMSEVSAATWAIFSMCDKFEIKGVGF